MTWVLNKAFYNKTYIYVNNYRATWYKRNDAIKLTKEQLINHISFLIDNIYIKIGNHIFRQRIGIPMGTDCAPFLANLYLYSLEYEFLDKAAKKNIFFARKFSNSYRYIDDLISFNNNNLINKYKHNIYPSQLILNKEKKSNNHTTFLDINITIKNTQIITNLYDKRDDFSFNINSFPFLASNIHNKRTHGVLISQLIRFSKVCSLSKDFITISNNLIHKLINQGFNYRLLRKKVSMFYDKYYHFIKKYEYNKPSLIDSLFEREV